MIPPCSYRGVPPEMLLSYIEDPHPYSDYQLNVLYYQALGYPGLLAANVDNVRCPVHGHMQPKEYMIAGVYFEFIRAMMPDDLFRRTFVYAGTRHSSSEKIGNFPFKEADDWMRHLQCVGLSVSYSARYDTFAVIVAPRADDEPIPDFIRDHYLEHFR